MSFTFEWDREKNLANIRKHGVAFREATTVFGDPLSMTIPDPRHSRTEARFVDLGLSHRQRLLVVAYTGRRGRIRIISARLVTRAERWRYEA